MSSDEFFYTACKKLIQTSDPCDHELHEPTVVTLNIRTY